MNGQIQPLQQGIALNGLPRSPEAACPLRQGRDLINRDGKPIGIKNGTIARRVGKWIVDCIVIHEEIQWLMVVLEDDQAAVDLQLVADPIESGPHKTIVFDITMPTQPPHGQE